MNWRVLTYYIFLIFLLAGCLKPSDTGPSFEEQLKIDLEAIDAYLEINNIPAIPDPNNLIRYIIHEEGNGDSPETSNCVTTSYEGKFFNGNTFDQSDNLAFPLDAVILGFQIGLPLLQVGDSATLYIPSGFGYGPQGAPGIPANSNLIFNLRLKGMGTEYNGSTGTCL